MRICSVPGCPERVRAGARGGRCLAHRRQADRARGSRTDRGYGADHQAARVGWQDRMDAGERVACHNPTCLHPGVPVDPANWHLGHDPQRSRRGPEHWDCNLSEAGKASRGPTN